MWKWYLSLSLSLPLKKIEVSFWELSPCFPMDTPLYPKKPHFSFSLSFLLYVHHILFNLCPHPPLLSFPCSVLLTGGDSEQCFLVLILMILNKIRASLLHLENRILSNLYTQSYKLIYMGYTERESLHKLQVV